MSYCPHFIHTQVLVFVFMVILISTLTYNFDLGHPFHSNSFNLFLCVLPEIVLYCPNQAASTN
jgi:hypothetical protein